MADATSLTPPSPGLSATLLPNKSVEPYTLGKSSNRSPENFNILAKIKNIQKIRISRDRYIIINVLYQIFILIDQFTQFPSR